MSNLPCSRAPLKVLSTPFVVVLVRPYAASEEERKGLHTLCRVAIRPVDLHRRLR